MKTILVSTLRLGANHHFVSYIFKQTTNICLDLIVYFTICRTADNRLNDSESCPRTLDTFFIRPIRRDQNHFQYNQRYNTTSCSWEWSTTTNINNNNDDGNTNRIGWCTNHRTIYVEWWSSKGMENVRCDNSWRRFTNIGNIQSAAITIATSANTTLHTAVRHNHIIRHHHIPIHYILYWHRCVSSFQRWIPVLASSVTTTSTKWMYGTFRPDKCYMLLFLFHLFLFATF